MPGCGMQAPYPQSSASKFAVVMKAVSAKVELPGVAQSVQNSQMR